MSSRRLASPKLCLRKYLERGILAHGFARVAKTVKEVAMLETDAAQEKRNADYSVAAEKCDATAGDARSNCNAPAKARFGKT